MFYDDKWYDDPLKWDEIYTDATDFITQINAVDPAGVGGITDTASLTELYEILSQKYLYSYTRYQTPEPMAFAIKRELQTEFPFYLEKKLLVDKMIALTDDEILRQTTQLRNLVDTHDEPIANADTVAFDDLSTQQENINVTLGKLQAFKDKYNAMNRDYLKGIYNRCDSLFRQILAEVVVYVYEEV